MLSENLISSALLEYFKNNFDKFYEANKEVIENYEYLKSKIQELESRVHLDYRLTLSNSTYSGKLINAKVKLPFAVNTNSKSKYPYFNVHVGKLSNYKNGLDDPQVKIDAEEKIEKFIDRKIPYIILNADNQPIVFHYSKE